MYKFYNAGHKIEEVFRFSLPTGADIHALGRWSMVAPKESFFNVPREINIGSDVIAVQFWQDIKRRFGKRGVVLIDPSHDPASEDADKPLEAYAVAPTEELAIERGEKLWDAYLEEICRAHFEDVQNAMSAGGAPRAARGFTIHALKLKGYRDPAVDFFNGMKDGQAGKVPAGTDPQLTGVLAAMQQQNQLMTTVLLAVATGEKIDPALLKNLITPQARQGDAVPAVIPENAGALQVEGQASSSLEQRINRKTVEYDTAKTHVGNRSNRAAAAAKQL